MNETAYEIDFVGAGPGAPDLITLRGKNLLEEAGLVMYAGSLVNPAILEHCSSSCIRVDSSGLSLEEQVRIMAEAVKKGNRVVRLHTGDPSLYGAVAEQKRLLLEQGISVRFVPGVSSLQAAASSLGIQYTVPGETQTLICTRRKGRTPVPETEELPLLASHGSTLVIFLSAGQAKEVRADLIAGGLDPQTPSACVYRATWEDEKIITAPLEDLPELMEQEGIHRHALMIIGKCIDPGDRRSLLYHSGFTHGYREGRS
jgi:precorrin-4/cobalt-precorrin-4 C11-methyltransferase